MDGKKGVDCIDVSTGGIINRGPNHPVYPGWQAPCATKIKESVAIDVATVGLFDDAGLAEHLLQTNQTDAVLIGRSLLRNTNWLNNAAKTLHEKSFQSFNHS